MPVDGTFKVPVFGGWKRAGVTNPGGGTFNMQGPTGGPLTPGFWEPGMPYPDPLTFQHTSSKGAAWMGGGTKDYEPGPFVTEYTPGWIYAPRNTPGGGSPVGPNTYAFADGAGGADYDAATDTVHDWAKGASLITASSAAGARQADAHTYKFVHGDDPIIWPEIQRATMERGVFIGGGMLYAEESYRGAWYGPTYYREWYRTVVYDMSAQPAAPLFDTGLQTTKAAGWLIGEWSSFTRVGPNQYQVVKSGTPQIWNVSAVGPALVGSGWSKTWTETKAIWGDQGLMLTWEDSTYDVGLGAFVRRLAIRDALTGGTITGPMTPSALGFPDDAWDVKAVSTHGQFAVARATRYHSSDRYHPQTMVRINMADGTVTPLGHYHFGDHPVHGYPYDHSTALTVRVLPDGNWVMLGEITPNGYNQSSHYALTSRSEHGTLFPDRQSTSHVHPSGAGLAVRINQHHPDEIYMVSHVPLSWMNGCVAKGAPPVGADFPTENASGLGAAHIGNVLISWWPTVGSGPAFTLGGASPPAPPDGFGGDSILLPTAWHTVDNNEPPPPGGTPGDGGVEAGWLHGGWMRAKDAPGTGRTGRFKVRDIR